jgi:hypothetical protein
MLVLALLAIALPAAGQDSLRLARPVEFPDDGSLPDDATAGQLTVAVYDRLQVTHGAAYRTMGDAFVCRSGDAKILAHAAREAAGRLPREQRDSLKTGDWATLTTVAIDAIGTLDGIDPARIRADEAIGPGVYNPAITIVGYTIRRCRFY